jgi:hypothetical protein
MFSDGLLEGLSRLMYLYQRPDKSAYEYRLANGSIKGYNRHAPTRRKVLFKTPIVINA